MNRHYVFKHYGKLSLFAIAVVATLLMLKHMDSNSNWVTGLTWTGAIISFFFAVQNQEREEIKLFKELFTQFNDRYDKLNERLNEISVANREVTAEERQVLYEYFNLCGEEFLFYKRGFIYPEVWKAWHNGMKFFMKNEWIRKVWEKEAESDSYYGLDFD